MTTSNGVENKPKTKTSAKSKDGAQITTSGKVERKPEKRKPDFNVYAIVPDGDATRIGGNIGCVFNHRSSTGFKIYLDAVPIPQNGKIQLIAFEVK